MSGSMIPLPSAEDIPTGLEAVHVWDASGRYLGRQCAVVEGHLDTDGPDARRWRAALEREVSLWTAGRQVSQLRARLAQERARIMGGGQ
jgi:hypothetical protein